MWLEIEEIKIMLYISKTLVQKHFGLIILHERCDRIYCLTITATNFQIKQISYIILNKNTNQTQFKIRCSEIRQNCLGNYPLTSPPHHTNNTAEKHNRSLSAVNSNNSFFPQMWKLPSIVTFPVSIQTEYYLFKSAPYILWKLYTLSVQRQQIFL